MSIEAMKKVNIIACRSDRKSILELIQSKGFIEVAKSKEDDIFYFEDTSEPLRQFDRNLELLSSAINITENIEPDKKPFYLDAEMISRADRKMARQNESDFLQNAKQITALSEEISQCNSEIENNQIRIIGLNAWSRFGYPLSLCNTKKTVIFTGSMGGNEDESGLYQKFSRLTDIPIYIEVVSSGKEQTCFYVIAHRDDQLALQNALSELGFVRAAIESQSQTPKQAAVLLRERNEELNNRIKECEQEIKSLCGEKRNFQILYDSFYSRKDKYQVIHKLLQTSRVFVLSGYMSGENAYAFSDILEKRYTAHMTVSDPADDEEVPIKLKNNWFARPLEPLVESFSMPAKEDIDPTFIMSLFYYFYFGMMFSDAGYGLLVMIVCGLLGFVFKNVKPGLQNSMRMFFFCGISTFIWGILYGSFFGNAISVISNGFFNVNLEMKPILFDPVKDPLRLLIISVAMGVIHILTANILKFITLWRTKRRLDAVFDAGFWIVLLLGISLTAIWFGADIAAAKIPALSLMAVGVTGQVLFAGRKNKNVVLRILSGIVSLYDLTGFLSDALSYSRLMALGLATGVIATVANLMGSLFGFGIPGGILFWIVFLAFHLINFAINMLGAYVHTNRLQYVEFFSKFYEGGGRKFEPFRRKYKYTRIKEND